MERDELYRGHLGKMFEKRKMEEYSDEEILSMLKNLISCLPNGGKLYKYRSIKGKAFNNAYDSLKKGYIWLSTADQFNDDEDCTLFYDPLSEAEALREYLFANIDILLKHILCKTNFVQTDKDKKTLDVLKFIDKTTGKIKKRQAISYLVQYGYDPNQINQYINGVQDLIDKLLADSSPQIEELVNEYLNINSKNRSQFYIYSLSEVRNSDTMWAHYANSNQGFCIEYDFSKALSLSSQIQRLLVCTFKVDYRAEKGPFSFVEILDCLLQNKQDSAEYQRLNFEFFKQIITKKTEWKEEKEWRILLKDVDHHLDADLVSGIIIDSRVIKTENAKKLISLSRKRGWELTVREIDPVRHNHDYIPYAEWQRRF